MFTSRSRIRKVVLACAVFGFAACLDPDDTRGTLIVPFELGNKRDCDTLGVESVRGELGDGKYVDEVRCEQGELRFANVREGSYRLRVFGYDDDDVAIMDSLQGDDLTMNVVGDGTTVVADRAVKLTSAPARLKLRWSFGFGTCKSAGIGAFAVTVWRNDGSDLLLEDELDCENVGTEDDGYYRQVPDERRLLMGTEMGEVSVQPLDSNGDEFGAPLTYKFSAPGPGREIKLSLKCDEDACWGTEDES